MKFSVTSGHVSRGKGNGWKSRVDRELYLRYSRERSSYRLDERSRGEIINGARASILPLSGAKMPCESCSRGAGGGGEGVLAHNRADPSLHARACVGSSTRGRCCGTRHDRYTFETDGGGAARKDEG